MTIENNFGSGSLELPNIIREKSSGVINVRLTMDKNHKRGIFMSETLKETIITDLNHLLKNNRVKFSSALFTTHHRKTVDAMKDQFVQQLGNFKLVMIPLNPRPGDPEVRYKYKWTGKGSGSNDDLVMAAAISIKASKSHELSPAMQLC